MTRELGIGASFLFELLDPKTGLPIPTLYERGKETSADRLTREQIIDYLLTGSVIMSSHLIPLNVISYAQGARSTSKPTG